MKKLGKSLGAIGLGMLLVLASTGNGWAEENSCPGEKEERIHDLENMLNDHIFIQKIQNGAFVSVCTKERQGFLYHNRVRVNREQCSRLQETARRRVEELREEETRVKALLEQEKSLEQCNSYYLRRREAIHSYNEIMERAFEAGRRGEFANGIFLEDKAALYRNLFEGELDELLEDREIIEVMNRCGTSNAKRICTLIPRQNQQVFVHPMQKR